MEHLYINLDGAQKHEDMEYLEAEISKQLQEKYGLGAEHDYIAFDEDHREIEVAEYIKESLWAFNTWFLLDHVPEGITEEALAIIQEKCEEANNPILAMVEDFDALVEEATSLDGYGHFLNSYDGEEYEVMVDGVEYYVYIA